MLTISLSRYKVFPLFPLFPLHLNVSDKYTLYAYFVESIRKAHFLIVCLNDFILLAIRRPLTYLLFSSSQAGLHSMMPFLEWFPQCNH